MKIKASEKETQNKKPLRYLDILITVNPNGLNSLSLRQDEQTILKNPVRFVKDIELVLIKHKLLPCDNWARRARARNLGRVYKRKKLSKD